MEEQLIAYCKQSGEPRVPLTIRIDWLPDGTLVPKMHWTPDGTCYQVLSCAERVPLAFLKDRGEGLRFKVKSEMIATYDGDEELLHSQYETNLYLADNRFCQRNMVDERYAHAGKEYITVTMDVFPDGDYELVSFCVHGVRYRVEKTHKVEPRGSFSAGGIGLRHKVEARLVNADDDEDPDPLKSVRRPAALYLEMNKWFVSVSGTA